MWLDMGYFQSASQTLDSIRSALSASALPESWQGQARDLAEKMCAETQYMVERAMSMNHEAENLCRLTAERG